MGEAASRFLLLFIANLAGFAAWWGLCEAIDVPLYGAIGGAVLVAMLNAKAF